jgi:hypothetical protein
MISGGSADLQDHHSPELPVRRIQAAYDIAYDLQFEGLQHLPLD